MACRESAAAGVPVRPIKRGCCCPFGAMLGMKKPMPLTIGRLLPELGAKLASDFTSSFDRGQPKPFYADGDARIHQLGLLFREHALSGEAW